VSYCPEHDPLLLAASIICGTCKGESFPSDAGWMPDGSILATFASEHELWCTRKPDFGIILLVPGAGQLVPRVQRPATPPVAAAWCTALTAAGVRCQFRAKGDGLCGVHLAQRAGRARGGRP
jgi:Family of unknown function (DUF5763)